MYSEEAIQTLVDRVAWAPPMQFTSYTLSTANATGNSGRLFSSYHPMCIVENVIACMPASDAVPTSQTITNTVLNDYLYQIKKQGALKILGWVFESEAGVSWVNSVGQTIDISSTDYSDKIIARSSLFDCAIGYQVAYDVLEMLLTSTRSNERQRIAQDRTTLLVAQQGYRDDEGNVITDGVLQKLTACVGKITGVMFPCSKKRPTIRDKSYLW